MSTTWLLRIGWTLILLGVLPYLGFVLGVTIGVFSGCLGAEVQDCAIHGTWLGDLALSLVLGIWYLIPGTFAAVAGGVMVVIAGYRGTS